VCSNTCGIICVQFFPSIAVSSWLAYVYPSEDYKLTEMYQFVMDPSRGCFVVDPEIKVQIHLKCFIILLLVFLQMFIKRIVSTKGCRSWRVNIFGLLSVRLLVFLF
jgi:hypothetical protein